MTRSLRSIQCPLQVRGASWVLWAAVLIALAFPGVGCGSGPDDGTTEDGELREVADAGVDLTRDEFLGTNLFFAGKGIHTYPGFDRFFIGPIRPWNRAARSTLVPRAPVESLLRETGLLVYNDRVVGLFDEQSDQQTLSVFGCAMCHAGKAAGRLIPGLGNKTIDIHEIAKLGLVDPGLGFKHNALTANADRMRTVLNDPSFYSPTVGLIENNVLMQTFYQAFGLHYQNRQKRFLNKPPHLWGLAAKRQLGLFWDGCGEPTAHGWMVGPEIMNGQTAENIDSVEYRARLDRLELVLTTIRAPKYPFKIDAARATNGRALFGRDCASCHGAYDAAASGVPRLVPASVVNTDANRAEFFAFPPFWRDVANTLPERRVF